MAGSVNQPQFALPLPKAVRKPNRDCPSPLYVNVTVANFYSALCGNKYYVLPAKEMLSAGGT
jgi:hypothetical protein